MTFKASGRRFLTAAAALTFSLFYAGLTAPAALAVACDLTGGVLTVTVTTTATVSGNSGSLSVAGADCTASALKGVTEVDVFGNTGAGKTLTLTPNGSFPDVLLDSTVASGSGSSLVVNGTTGADDVSVSADVADIGSSVSGTYSVSGVGYLDAMTVNAGAGNDTVTATESLGGTFAFTVNGGAGNDVLTGDAEPDTFNGDADADTITGGGGTNPIAGGTGNDTYYVDNALENSANSVSVGTLSVVVTLRQQPSRAQPGYAAADDSDDDFRSHVTLSSDEDGGAGDDDDGFRLGVDHSGGAQGHRCRSRRHALDPCARIRLGLARLRRRRHHHG